MSNPRPGSRMQRILRALDAQPGLTAAQLGTILCIPSGVVGSSLSGLRAHGKVCADPYTFPPQWSLMEGALDPVPDTRRDRGPASAPFLNISAKDREPLDRDKDAEFVRLVLAEGRRLGLYRRAA